jgi:hypothetical protein
LSDSLSLRYGTEVKQPESRRNRHFMGSQAGGNGFRGSGSSWPQLDSVRDHYCGNPLRTMIASMATMLNHVHMAAPPLKKEIPIESKKMAGIVKPLIRKKRTMARSWCSASRRERGHCVALWAILSLMD